MNVYGKPVVLYRKLTEKNYSNPELVEYSMYPTNGYPLVIENGQGDKLVIKQLSYLECFQNFITFVDSDGDSKTVTIPNENEADIMCQNILFHLSSKVHEALPHMPIVLDVNKGCIKNPYLSTDGQIEYITYNIIDINVTSYNLPKWQHLFYVEEDGRRTTVILNKDYHFSVGYYNSLSGAYIIHLQTKIIFSGGNGIIWRKEKDGKYHLLFDKGRVRDVTNELESFISFYSDNHPTLKMLFDAMVSDICCGGRHSPYQEFSIKLDDLQELSDSI